MTSNDVAEAVAAGRTEEGLLAQLTSVVRALRRDRDGYQAEVERLRFKRDLTAELVHYRSALTQIRAELKGAPPGCSIDFLREASNSVLKMVDAALSAAPAQPEGAAERPVTGKQHEGDCWDAQEEIDRLRAALAGVIRIADRKTPEFDAAREALAGAPASQQSETSGVVHVEVTGGQEFFEKADGATHVRASTSEVALPKTAESTASPVHLLQHRLDVINEIACYVSEEDTSARYEGLIEIGKLARGEPSAWDRSAPKAGERQA